MSLLGRDGMPAPIAWSGLGSTTIQQHYVTWSLTRSTKVRSWAHHLMVFLFDDSSSRH